MPVYTVEGENATRLYAKNGTPLQQAYNVNGAEVYQWGGSLKVATYNVGQWYYGGHVVVPSSKDAEYYALQNGMLHNINPDILCLEEYLSEFSAAGRSAVTMLQQYFPYIHEENGTGTVSSGTGRCICSKYPISDYTTHQYTTSGGPRYFDSCTVNLFGTPVTVVVTHLNYNANSDSARLGQLRELITYLQTQTRFIACGDFNMLACKSTTDADYLSMMVPLLNAGFHCANCTDFGFLETYSDAPTGPYTGCLDNIVTSSNIAITSAYVDETKLTDQLTERTDHMPLVATLQIGGIT